MADSNSSLELTDPHTLKLLGHGTDGSDGIEQGVHLRWAFNHKLGFPDCISLYRRPSDMQSRYFWNGFNAKQNLKVGNGGSYSVKIPGILDFYYHFESTTANGYPFQPRTADGVTNNVLYIQDGDLTITFWDAIDGNLHNVDRIELGFLIDGQSEFEFETHQTGKINSFPQHILGTYPGWKDVYFDAKGATGITLKGKEIQLYHLAVWICGSIEGTPWEEIKLDCGCGLPIIPHVKPEPDEVHTTTPILDSVKLSCRLNRAQGTPDPFTEPQIEDVSELALDIYAEGLTSPHGWTLFADNPPQAGNGESEADVPIYDYLLTQSLHAPVGKALDLLYVDNGVYDVYHDYRVEAIWSPWNMRQLECEITFDAYEAGQTFGNVFTIDSLIFEDAGLSEIVELNNTVARTSLGLALSGIMGSSSFRFPDPVTEVQLWILNPNNDLLEITAYKDYQITYVDKRELSASEGIIRLAAGQINEVKITGGSNVILARVHFDAETGPGYWQEKIICGVRSNVTPYPLERPHGLEVSFMSGGLVNEDQTPVRPNPYMAGLRWTTNQEADTILLPHHPFAYQIERTASDGTVVDLTGGNPILISPSDEEASVEDRPEGWPAERQYYMDNLDVMDTYEYQVSAMDIFGRTSVLSNPKTLNVDFPPPPPPENVTAKYLDYSTYNPVTNSSTDKNLSSSDVDWLAVNGTSAVVVRWDWPGDLSKLAPDVDSFDVFLHEGWLNTFTAKVLKETQVQSLDTQSYTLTPKEKLKFPALAGLDIIPVWSIQVALDAGESVPQDALRMSWFRQQNMSYLILKNTAGTTPELYLFKTGIEEAPIIGKGGSVAVLPDKSGHIDYALPQNWTGVAGWSHNVTKHASGKKTYEVYIPSAPFPAQPVTLKESVRYGQIGVCSVAQGVQGGVSKPATIMAVHQLPPRRPGLPVYSTITPLKATPADVHGKSTFHLRWPKVGDDVQHHVYRAVDTTLFAVDNARRPTDSRTPDSADYSQFQNEQFDTAAIEALRKKSNPDVALAQYANLSDTDIYLLARMPENEAAFTRINAAPILESDPDYQDRETGIPDLSNPTSYNVDPNIVMYEDESLDGRSINRYFYKIQSIGPNGLTSDLSEPTLPIECPQVTPPRRPVITSVDGGEEQVTLRWAKPLVSDIAGYLVYRTEEKRYATDWRRMDLIKGADSDAFSLEITDAVLANADLEYVDTSAEPRKTYYYAIVAIRLGDTGKWLRSPVSQPRAGQAYKLAPPVPPTISLIEWIKVDETGAEYGFNDVIPAGDVRFPAVKIEWTHLDPAVECMVQYSADYLDDFSSVSDWLSAGVYSFVHKNAYHNFDHTYRILVRDAYGNRNVDFQEIIIDLING